MPVRVRIHSSLVSTSFSRSALVTTRSGTWVPSAVMQARLSPMNATPPAASPQRPAAGRPAYYIHRAGKGQATSARRGGAAARTWRGGGGVPAGPGGGGGGGRGRDAILTGLGESDGERRPAPGGGPHGQQVGLGDDEARERNLRPLRRRPRMPGAVGAPHARRHRGVRSPGRGAGDRGPDRRRRRGRPPRGGGGRAPRPARPWGAPGERTSERARLAALDGADAGRGSGGDPRHRQARRDQRRA